MNFDHIMKQETLTGDFYYDSPETNCLARLSISKNVIYGNGPLVHINIDNNVFNLKEATELALVILKLVKQASR